MSKNILGKFFDWKKTADVQLEQQDAELAFAKSATSILADKAAPFMKDPYYLGFEVVKTDQSFTKMIGIFVFRVNKGLFYVPVFYIDGELKPVNLLYSVNEKLFVLLSPEWCEFYLNKTEPSQAELTDAKQENMGTQDLQLRWLAYPPYMSKGAAYEVKTGIPGFPRDGLTKKAGYKPLSPLSIFNFIKEARDEFTKEDYLKACESLKDGEADKNKHLVRSYLKKSGYEMMDKLASWVENDIKFADNFVTFCDIDEDLLQKDILDQKRLEVEREKANKKIAAVNQSLDQGYTPKAEGQIRIYKGRFNPFTNKTASEQIRDGISIEDLRKEDELNAVILSPTEQFNGFEQSLGYGAYNMLKSDGDVAKVFVVSGGSDGHKVPALIFDAESNPTAGVIWYDDTHNAKNLHDATPNGYKAFKAGVHKQEVPFAEILMDRILDEGESKSIIDRFVKDKPEKGKMYGIYDAKYSYLSDEAFYVKEVIPADEGEGYTVIASLCDGYAGVAPKKVVTVDDEVTIVVNPNEDKIHVDLKVFSPRAKWIEVPFKLVDKADDIEAKFDGVNNISKKTGDIWLEVKVPDYMPGTLSTFYSYVGGSKHSDASNAGSMNLKSASVKYYMSSDEYTIESPDHGKLKNVLLNKTAATVQLMYDFGYSQEQSEEILDFAKNNKKNDRCDFFYKQAARIILDPDPEWYHGYDSDLNIRAEYPETRVLQTLSFEEDAPAPRYGDFAPRLGDVINETSAPDQHDDDTTENVFLSTASPNMLAELAKATGKSSLFEHGVIGSLSKISDASTVVSEYLPDMYQGQDKVGRLIFLMYASPQLFLTFYGADDMASLENTMTSVFKQQGELILELSKRSKMRQINVTDAEFA